MTPTTSQAVRDAYQRLSERFVTVRLPVEAWVELFAEVESAVRADEAAGLVDILARLVGSRPLLSAWCLHCDGKPHQYAPRTPWTSTIGDSYIAHTPDCPWVEGMNAVAERRGNA